MLKTGSERSVVFSYIGDPNKNKPPVAVRNNFLLPERVEKSLKWSTCSRVFSEPHQELTAGFKYSKTKYREETAK